MSNRLELLPKSNLLASFSQTKMNYQSPQFIPAQPNQNPGGTSVTASNATTAIIPQQPPKDIFVSPDSEMQPKNNSIKTFVKNYGGLTLGGTALAVSAIGIPLSIRKAKNAGNGVISGLRDAVSELSGKVKDLDIETQVKEAIKAATKDLPQAQQQKPITSKLAALTTALLGIGTGAGIVEFLKNNDDKIKAQGYSEDEINTAKNTATSIIEKPVEAMKKADSVQGIANEARSVAYDAKNTAYAQDSRVGMAVDAARDALDTVTGHADPLMKLYTEPYYDLRLLSVRNYLTKIDLEKSKVAINNDIKTASSMRLDRSAAQTLADIKSFKEKYPQLTSQWMLTAEYTPIKKGGLGVVPVDLQDNFTRLGIDTPLFIPMYLHKNKSEFKQLTQYNEKTKQEETLYSYKYGKDTFNLSKLAETIIPTYRNGRVYQEKIEFYSTQKDVPGTDKKKTLIFVKNNDYFREDLYSSTPFAEEPERFALFTKSVYTLAKYKVSTALNSTNTGVENINITDKKAFEELKAPNSMILNDWHAGTMAGLLRYRAPMEYAYKELESIAYTALKDMPCLMIGHNLGVQGTSQGANSMIGNNHIAENIINTLFDNYAIAITANAESGLYTQDSPNDDMANTVLMKRKTGDKHFNSLFLGVALSDWFEIVSPNHSKECINDPNQSGILYPLLQRRQHTGTIGGILNGLDKNKNDMQAVSKKNYVPGLELNVYDQNTDIGKIMDLRKENKRLFYQKFYKPLVIDKNYVSANTPELVKSDAGNLNISEEEFINAPLLAWAHRMTNQKGLKYMQEATERLFDNWENLFPGKPMPVVIAGGLPEDEKQLQYLDKLRDPNLGSNKARLGRTVALKGNMPNPAIMSASTFFLGPSDFEPCGLIQGECFAKGTPVIVTDVGGFHDTVVDGVTGFLAANPSTNAVYDKMVEGLKMYFNEYDKYKQMVKNDLAVDFSWARPGKQGPIYEYTDKLGFDRDSFEDIAMAA